MTISEPPPHPDAPPTAPASFAPPQNPAPHPAPATPPASRRSLYILVGALGTLTLGAAVAITAILADDDTPASVAPTSPATAQTAPPAPAPSIPAAAPAPGVVYAPEQLAAFYRNAAPSYSTPTEAAATAHITRIVDVAPASTVYTDYGPAGYVEVNSLQKGQWISACLTTMLRVGAPTTHGRFTVVTATGEQMWAATY
ncbi:hypothetical protein [Streptomyces virginiae]|uniref:hypothetical protein n=1 Tax=Streptomyces virginiae TaxID=1961 RepID=UPI002250A644|nr:hypothetical protein [Streptomyces virginiae]MCX5174468.1 hypothetical protein [Streptomyces virginiae]